MSIFVLVIMFHYFYSWFNHFIILRDTFKVSLPQVKPNLTNFFSLLLNKLLIHSKFISPSSPNNHLSTCKR